MVVTKCLANRVAELPASPGHHLRHALTRMLALLGALFIAVARQTTQVPMNQPLSLDGQGRPDGLRM
jgi:hypothetical protein